jgi:hypothetical protein
MIKTDTIPARAKPLPHSAMRSNQFIDPARGLELLEELDSLIGDLEGIKSFEDTCCHYKNDVFTALSG